MGLVLVGSPTDDRLTDAFAVCNHLDPRDQKGEEAYWELPLQLVDQVRFVLRRHCPERPSAGWISGLDKQEGERHPAKREIRSGKEVNEGGPDEPLSSSLEWARDAQSVRHLTARLGALSTLPGPPLQGALPLSDLRLMPPATAGHSMAGLHQQAVP